MLKTKSDFSDTIKKDFSGYEINCIFATESPLTSPKNGCFVTRLLPLTGK
jgi:hypothetical protein